MSTDSEDGLSKRVWLLGALCAVAVVALGAYGVLTTPANALAVAKSVAVKGGALAALVAFGAIVAHSASRVT